MITPERIMGFIEGEGCFGVAIYFMKDNRPRKTARKCKWKNPSLGFQIKPSFRISLARKDRKILDEIKEFFGTGYVYEVKEKADRSLMCQYAVQTVADLLQLITFFDQQLFYTTKGDSYSHWKEIVQMMSRKEHLSREGFLKVCDLRGKMNLIFNKEKRLRSSQELELAIGHIRRADDPTTEEAKIIE